MFNRIKNKHLKEFYVRDLRLIMYSNYILNFKIRFQSLLTVMMSKTDGWLNNEATPSEECREYILNLIKCHTDNFIDVEENYDENNDYSYEDNDSDEQNITDSISEFLEKIQTKSQINANIQVAS